MSHCLPASAEASGDGLHLPRSVLHGEMERWMQKQHIVALRIAGSRAFIYVRSVIGRDAGNFRLQSQEQCKRCVQGASPTLPCKCRPDCNGAFPTGWEYASQRPGHLFPTGWEQPCAILPYRLQAFFKKPIPFVPDDRQPFGRRRFCPDKSGRWPGIIGFQDKLSR